MSEVVPSWEKKLWFVNDNVNLAFERLVSVGHDVDIKSVNLVQRLCP